MKTADEFNDKTAAPNLLWQTDFTNRNVTGWVVLSQHGLGRRLALYHRLGARPDRHRDRAFVAG